MQSKKELESTGKKLNLGLDKLEKLMEPSEVWITNAPKIEKIYGGCLPFRGKVGRLMRADEIVVELRKSDKYESVRVIPEAFDVKGNLLSGSASVVGKLKQF